MIKKRALFLASVVLFTLAGTATAGGGLISFPEVSPSTFSLAPGGYFYVTPQVQLQNSDSYDMSVHYCQNCKVKLGMENPQSSDKFEPEEGYTDGNGKFRFKVTSNISGNRYLYAEATMPDGSVYRSSRLLLRYDGQTQWEPNIPTVTPFPTSVPVLKATVIPTTAPKAPVVEKEIEPTEKPMPTLKDTSELEKKVDDLERELAESKKQQATLESRLNALINWVRSVFPFFR